MSTLMNDVNQIFTAKAATVGETIIDFRGGNAGFKIPDYQRTYDWSEEHLQRLMQNCCSGFYQLSQLKNRIPHTFLGTIILVHETSEPGFEGESFALVDGQQRITSLVLLCCSLYVKIRSQVQSEEFQNLPSEYKTWLDKESRYFLNQLYACTTGRLQTVGESQTFPRIIRSDANESRARDHSEYLSDIARLLDLFHKFCVNNKPTAFNPNSFLGDTESMKRLLDNYRILSDLGNVLCYENLSKKFDVDRVEREKLQERQMKRLFRVLPKYEQRTQDKFGTMIGSCEQTESLIRLLQFSSYLLNFVILTRVVTEDEDSAFDIFDALNTTGEPLTAVETLKPMVVKFENEKRRFQGSECDISFRRLESHLNEVFQNTHKRHTETKELLTSFALYLNGDKLSLLLRDQRSYLRTNFDSISNPKLKRKFIGSVADIAEFRHEFWIPEPEGNCGTNIRFNSSENRESFQLCLAFLRAMKTNLTVPIIARYWRNFLDDHNEEEFVLGVKAITAFVALRRAFTGGTDGIDDELRSLMGTNLKPERKHSSLSVGNNFSREIWPVEKLKSELLWKLTEKVIGSSGIDESSRDSWVKGAKGISLYTGARSLCKFLLLAATHQSTPDEDNPGLLRRKGVAKSDELDLFNIRVWNDPKYKTVEHIAPQKYCNGWDAGIYESRATPHTIGNLTLLPSKVNTSASNAKWDKKKIFYMVFSSKEEQERKKLFMDVKGSDLEIKLSTLDLLTRRLQILDSITNVKEWTPNLIETRSENILGFAWDTLQSWLVE